MASKKDNPDHKYCSIMKWIEEQDNDFANALKDICMENRLANATFLYPTDKAYRKEIIDKAEKETEVGLALAESLIIPDVLVTENDFISRPIGSKGGIKYEAELVGGKVMIQKTVELAQAPTFRPLNKRTDRDAVWLIVKGKLPTTGEPFSPNSKRVKKGGAPDNGSGISSKKRSDYAQMLESKFIACACKDNCSTQNPFLEAVVSLLNFLNEHHKEIFETIVPLIDSNPVIAFYILFEPYKLTGDYLIPHGVLYSEDGWNEQTQIGNLKEDYLEFFTQTYPCLLYTDLDSVKSAISSARESCGQVPPKAIPKVTEIYSQLIANNSINSASPIYPASTIKNLTADKKLWQDEFRITISKSLEDARVLPPSEKESSLKKIFDNIKLTWPGDDYIKERRYTKKSAQDEAPVKRDGFEAISLFIKSHDFLYIPDVSEPIIVGGARSKHPITAEHVYNRNIREVNRLKKINQNDQGGAHLSRQTLQELKAYVKRYGSLPSAVLSLVKN